MVVAEAADLVEAAESVGVEEVAEVAGGNEGCGGLVAAEQIVKRRWLRW